MSKISKTSRLSVLTLVCLAIGCGAGSNNPGGNDPSTGGTTNPARGSGGSAGKGQGGQTGAGGSGPSSSASGGTSGGAGGASGGAGGASSAEPSGSGGVTGRGGAGPSGSGGAAVDAAGSGGAPSAPVGDAAAPDGMAVATPLSMDPKQGPLAPGKLVYSQDFENGMVGMSRSPTNLPEDRAQIIDDPTGQRGKIVKIEYRAGDNFRTSAGTEPRSWFSSAMGYTARPNTKVSVAWGFMWQNTNMGAHFAQIIRDGGPLWMMGVDTGGTARGRVHRGSGGTSGVKIEPMKWYDFRVDTDYRAGGSIKFFVNGQMIGQGTGAGGGNGRFDCGIYWMGGGRPARTVYVSNVSIAEQD
jgi:hypothetical protein